MQTYLRKFTMCHFVTVPANKLRPKRLPMSMDSEKLILELNFRNDLIDERRKDSYFKNSKMFDLVPETIVDKRTLTDGRNP